MKKMHIRISLTLLLVAGIAWNINWEEIAGSLARVHYSWLFLSAALAFADPFFLAIKYRKILQDTSLDHSLGSLMSINLVSQFYALLIPSALGPAAVRWYKITRNKGGKSFFLAATGLERGIFVCMLLACGSLPLLFIGSHSALISVRMHIFPILAVTLCITLGGLGYILSPAWQSAFHSWLYKMPFISRSQLIDSFVRNFSLGRVSSHLVYSLCLLTLGWQIVFVVRIFLLYQSLQLPLSLLDACWMGSLVLLLQILPLSLAGIGIREGAYGYLFTLYGLPAEEGYIIGVLFFVQMLLVAFAGGLSNVFSRS